MKTLKVQINRFASLIHELLAAIVLLWMIGLWQIGMACAQPVRWYRRRGLY